MSLQREIETAINRASAENASDTPDYILASFLTECLAAFNVATRTRDKYHGFTPAAAMGRAPITEAATDA